MMTKLTKQQTVHSTLMKKRKRIWWSTSTLIGACLLGLGLTLAQAQPPEKKAEPKKTGHKLTGAELYQINCNRCHAERYPTEWTSAQWKTLMTHMRVRANLPAAQAREILKYLQEDSGS
jgi:mono/diheme cytochrome c family protein